MLELAITKAISVSNDFRNLIKNGNYEKYVLLIIQASQEIFLGKQLHFVEKQSNGECDYIDQYGVKYDAKLVFNKKQGALLGDSKNELDKWIEVMRNESIEFSHCIEKRDLSLVRSTQLYAIMKDRIESTKEDENPILFIPFQLVDDCEDCLYLQMATDFFQAVYDKLVEDNIVKKRMVYFIYPSLEPEKYVLRDTHRRREYVKCPALSQFIIFNADIKNVSPLHQNVT